MTRSKRASLLALFTGLLLISASLACSLPLASNQPTPTVTLEPTDQPTLTLEPSPDQAGTPTVAQTPGQGTADPNECAYDASFVSDVTIPDGTTIGPGDAFNKTWRLKNTGCQTWATGTKLFFVQGDQMGGPASVDVPLTAVNGQQDVTVGLVGPMVGGVYRGYWQLKAPDGILFGPKVYVEILVPDVGLPPSTSGPDLVIQDINPSATLLWASTAFDMNITVKNQGDQNAAASQVGCMMSGTGAGKTVNVPAIAAGGNAVVKCSYTLLAGSYTFQAIADTTAIINEADEGNNSRQYDLTVITFQPITLIPMTLMPLPVTLVPLLRPDLTITNVAFLNNQSIMQITIKNQGTGNAAATKVFCSAENPQGQGDGNTANVPAISAGATHVMNCLNLPSGTIVAAYFVEIDPNDTVLESNETNNIWQVN